MFKREDIIRETALIQRGLTRISKSPLNIVNYFILGIGLFIIITIASDDFFNQKGLIVLAGLTVCNFIFIFLYSFAYFSRVISEEKESRTMTLLRLTPVRPTNIFFGKLLPPFINLMQMLIFQIPIVVFAITMGGVNMEQIISVYTILILTACIFAVIGVWVSSSNPENWLAYFNFIFMTFLVVLAYGGVQMMRYKPYMRDIAKYLKIENPFSKAGYIIFRPMDDNAHIFHTIIIYSLFIIVGFIFAYRSFLRNLDVDNYAARDIEKKKNNTSRSINFGRLPLLNKEYHFGCGGKRGQILVLSLFIVMGLLFFFSEKGTYSYYDAPSILSKIACLQIFCIALFLVYIIGNSFKKELKENTWDGILISPLTAKDIIHQKVLGALKFISPFVALIIVLLLFNMNNLQRDYRYILREFPAIWILPSCYLAAISTCIYFQLFEKFPSLLVGMFSGAVISLMLVMVAECRGSEQTAVIIGVNLSMIVAAFSFYFMSIRTINAQINLKSKD